jgi:hypothetical protein
MGQYPSVIRFQVLFKQGKAVLCYQKLENIFVLSLDGQTKWRAPLGSLYGYSFHLALALHINLEGAGVLGEQPSNSLDISSKNSHMDRIPAAAKQRKKVSFMVCQEKKA